MKNRLLISILFFSFFSLVSVNESKAQMSVTANLGFINIPDYEINLIGFNAAGKYSISEKLRVGLNLGVFIKSEDNSTLSIMPITGLVEYSLTTNAFSPYIGADVGLYRIGTSYSYGGETESDSQMELGLAPVVGFNFALSDKMSLNSNLKYHYIMTEGDAIGAIGLNAGLTFNF